MSLLDDISARGAELRTRVHELFARHNYLDNIKNRVLAGYVAIALEHHKGIWLLKDKGLRGSALALVRTVMDPWLRALWINACATDEQIEQAWLDKLRFPKMHEMRADIQQAYFGHAEQDAEFAAIVKKFFKGVRKAWSISSSYTHSGGRQIARRFTGDEMNPNYSDTEVAQALNLSTTALMLLMRAFFMSMGKQPDADEVEKLSMQYFVEFKGRLRGESVSDQ
jgi:hypothetical protein